jgi:hypothetical protein
MTYKNVKIVLFALLVISIAVPATQMANATAIDKIKEHTDELDRRIQNLEQSSDFNIDSKKQSERDFYKTAKSMIIKMEEKSNTADQSRINELDKAIGKDFQKLNKLVRTIGTVIEATPVEVNSDGSPLITRSIGTNTPITMAMYSSSASAPIIPVTSGTHYFSTTQSRNTCQNISTGTMTGSLTDKGNYQFLSVLTNYPSSVKNGNFPNCTTKYWSYGALDFIDVFGLTVCTANITYNSGWHGGNCNGWSSVGPLTVASANANYNGVWYNTLPGLGFVI